jgi:predicted dehydrogenase/nucleoside-diphosphate-sugar epimerase
MNLLITGASGFLGGYLVERALAANHRVRALVRNTSRIDRLERLGVEIVRGDLKNVESLRLAVRDIEGVVSAASTTDGILQETEAATIKGTRDLLAAAEQAGVRRFIHISSIGIHAVRRLSPGEKITEDYPLEKDVRFLSEYVRSKIASEEAALEFGLRGRMNVIVVRPGLLYGPRGPWTLPRMGYAFGNNFYLLVGSGRNRLPVCYVENCADACIVAVENSNVAADVFNIVDDEQVTQSEFLQRLKREANSDLRLVRVPYSVFYPFALLGESLGKMLRIPFPFRSSHIFMCGWRARYSNEHAKSVLGWKPQIDKSEALSRTMKYYAGRNRPSRKADLKLLQQPRVIDPPTTMCMIGCGVIAEEHLNILRRMPGVRVAGICDSNPEAARKLGSQFGVSHTYDDPSQMLAAEKPQAVHIVTPPQSHAMLTELAIRQGCHVFVEKPMAVNAQEARAMAEIAARHGKKLCVGHCQTYDPIIVRTRRMVESGELGDILWVESYYGFNLGSNPDSRYMLPGGEKHWTFQLPGGLYQNLASHPLSLALDFLGKPTKIYAHARYGRILPHAATDELRILMETPRASGMAVVSLAASPRSEFVNIYGTKMTICADLLNKWIIVQGAVKGLPRPVSRALMHLRHGTTVLGGTVGGLLKVLRGTWTYTDGMDLLIREFYSSLGDGGQPPVTAEEGILTMEIMDAAWQQIGMTEREYREEMQQESLTIH